MFACLKACDAMRDAHETIIITQCLTSTIPTVIRQRLLLQANLLQVPNSSQQQRHHGWKMITIPSCIAQTEAFLQSTISKSTSILPRHVRC
jgi:hypothetical protein